MNTEELHLRATFHLEEANRLLNAHSVVQEFYRHLLSHQQYQEQCHAAERITTSVPEEKA